MKTHEPLTWLTCLALLSSFPGLAAEQTAIVKDAHVNVRGQPSLAGEVITQLQQGEKVVVLEEVASSKGKTNEPAKWVRIEMPAKTPVWVYAPFIDAASKSVKVPRLNLRAGPGENFSVVGRLQRGSAVSEIRRSNDWIEIETPPGAYAFIAADLLTKPGEAGEPAVVKREPPPAVPAVSPEPVKPETATTTKLAPEQPKEQKPEPLVSTLPTSALVVVPPPAELPKTPPPATKPPAHESPAVAATTVIPFSPAPRTQTVPTPAPQSNEEAAPQKRVVRRQGLVRSTVSIQAPTYYELLSPENRKTINYLHTDTIGVNLKDYRGRTIIVTGEEAIDPRWPRTPVIEVETLELIP